MRTSPVRLRNTLRRRVRFLCRLTARFWRAAPRVACATRAFPVLVASARLVRREFARARFRSLRILAASARLLRAIFARATFLSRFSAVLLPVTVLVLAARSAVRTLRVLAPSMRLLRDVLARANDLEVGRDLVAVTR